MRSRAIEYEERRAKGVQLARDISALLRRSGFPKAGPYRPYGTRDPGYVVFECGNGTQPIATATCLWIDNRHHDNPDTKQLDAVLIAIQTDERFVVEQRGDALRVTRTAVAKAEGKA